jgi:hypothetical protein
MNQLILLDQTRNCETKNPKPYYCILRSKFLNLPLIIVKSTSYTIYIMKDIFEKIKNNRGPIGEHSKESHGYFTFPKLEGEIGPHMEFRGRKRLNWSLNNYLGLANHPEVRKADADAAAQLWFGTTNGRSYDVVETQTTTKQLEAGIEQIQ